MNADPEAEPMEAEGAPEAADAPAETTETPAPETETPEAPEGAEAPETPEAGGASMGEILKAFREAEKTGLLKKGAETTVIQKIMLSAAEKVKARSEERRYKPLKEAWAQMTDEDKAKYFEEHGVWKETLKMAASPSKKIVDMTKVRIVPNWFLGIKDYDPMEVRTMVSCGALDAPEAVAAASDKEMINALATTSTIVKLAKYLPYLEELAIVDKPLQIASYLSKYLGKEMPAVRTEMKRRHPVEEAVTTEHKALDTATTPPGILHEEIPKEEAA